MSQIHSLVYKLQCLKPTNLRIFCKDAKKWISCADGMVEKLFTEFRSDHTSTEIFCIDICVWENSMQDECRECSQSTKNAFVWPLRNKILPILTAIPKSFCVELWRLMKHGSTIMLPNHLQGQNSGINLVKVHQSVQERTNRLGKLWLVLLWCTWGDLYRLPWERKNDYWSILCCIIGLIGWGIQEERVIFEEEKILFHDDNAPFHTSNIAQSKKHELGFESLPYPPYSPDLTLSDYYLFPYLKR